MITIGITKKKTTNRPYIYRLNIKYCNKHKHLSVLFIILIILHIFCIPITYVDFFCKPLQNFKIFFKTK